MIKLNDSFADLFSRWYKQLEEYKGQFVGKKPTEKMMVKIKKDLGVSEVVFWNYEGFGIFSDIRDLDATKEKDGYKTDYVISSNWKLATEEDDLIYSSNYEYFYLDIGLLDKKTEV